MINKTNSTRLDLDNNKADSLPFTGAINPSEIKKIVDQKICIYWNLRSNNE
jgi:hypothetical protein